MWQSQTHPKGLSLRSVRVPLALLTAAAALKSESVMPTIMSEAGAEASASALEAVAPAVDRVLWKEWHSLQPCCRRGGLSCGIICCNSE